MGEGSIDYQKWLERGFHVALILGSAYLATHPQYAWAIPALQAVGQALQQPR